MFYLFVIGILAPPAVALMICIYSIIRYMITRRGVTTKNFIATEILGIAAIFFPKLLSDVSRKHLLRFMWSFSFLVVYGAVLSVAFGK